jgi:hypothetical protein
VMKPQKVLLINLTRANERCNLKLCECVVNVNKKFFLVHIHNLLMTIFVSKF